MQQVDVDAVVQRVRWMMESASRGTVITVTVDGSVTTEGQRSLARLGWLRASRPLTAFIVLQLPLSPMEIRARIEEALELIDT